MFNLSALELVTYYQLILEPEVERALRKVYLKRNNINGTQLTDKVRQMVHDAKNNNQEIVRNLNGSTSKRM